MGIVGVVIGRTFLMDKLLMKKIVLFRIISVKTVVFVFFFFVIE